MVEKDINMSDKFINTALHAFNTIESQLTGMLKLISESEYTCSSKNLSGSSIGQHTRHIIEFYNCLQQHYTNGIVNYDNRKRDSQIERYPTIAINHLNAIKNNFIQPNKPLFIETNFSNVKNSSCIITSTYYRELAYLIEHSIHHLALIKIGVQELTSIVLDKNFGVAFSTIRYQIQVTE